MTELEIQKKIAQLEFVNDQLDSELQEIDRLLRMTGFPNGISSAKEVALQLMDEGFLDAA